MENIPGTWWRIESPITRGFPDLVGTFMGKTAFVECKAAETVSGVSLSRDQRRVLCMLPNSWLFLYENRQNCYKLFAARNAAEERRSGMWIPAVTVPTAEIDLTGWLTLARMIWNDASSLISCDKWT